ncbi:MAG TPA: XdhC family protein, partial [Giesbergeria sp.]|nr:XdhC family protein [Giesbergeria sp.]
MTSSGAFLHHLREALKKAPACLVTVQQTEGSTPRERGAWMAVAADAVVGTIGGGHVEFQAIAEARRRLAGGPGAAVLRYALGPSLGQCCGGVMHLRYEQVTQADAAALEARLAPRLVPLALFGGGHVGQALARV